jgi:hypothetical protein
MSGFSTGFGSVNGVSITIRDSFRGSFLSSSGMPLSLLVDVLPATTQPTAALHSVSFARRLLCRLSLAAKQSDFLRNSFL